MRYSHTCPKCGSRDIITVPGKAGAYGSGNYIPLGMTIFSTAPVYRYVCCGCGYTEEWIDREDIQKVKAHYGGESES